jgi:hypothetical protein
MKNQLKNLTFAIVCAGGMSPAFAATPTEKTPAAMASNTNSPTKGATEMYPAGTVTD